MKKKVKLTIEAIIQDIGYRDEIYKK